VWAREVAPKGKWRACFARAATAASGEHDALKHIMFVFLSRSVFDDFRQF
jgi:GH43 family beta-xylosidase